MKKTNQEEVTAYTLREIPVGVWQSFKVKCAQGGIPMRAKMIELIEKFNKGEKQ